MRTLYLECNMGAAGDMLTAALFELIPNQEAFLHKLNQVGIEKVHTHVEKMNKCGIVATHVTVKVDGIEEESHQHHEESHQHHEHSHQHHGLREMECQIDSLKVSEQVKKDAKAVYQLLAEAESRVHGTEVTQIHFHEVGNQDALADIVAVCMLLEELRPDCIYCSPIHVGCGQVKCSHGILPVPAPATALLLTDIPTYSNGRIQGELCTPTGAALLRYFVKEFCPQPVMKVSKIGYGCGKKDFEQANVVRAMLGETDDKVDEIVELSCNIDDMTPESVAFAMEELFLHHALDVYTIPVGTKKNRTGILLTCMCKKEDRNQILECIFKHTSTLGVREQITNRYILDRKISEVETPYGVVHVKEASGYGVHRKKAEYEDLATIARKNQLSLDEVRTLEAFLN